MANGGGGASSVALGLLIIVVIIQYSCVEAATYTVGGLRGWGFVSYDKWVSSTKFKAGDTLVFNYPRNVHDVVKVGLSDYKKCMATARRARRYSSGQDKIVLNKGWNYFICSVTGHCDSGMKLAVKAY